MEVIGGVNVKVQSAKYDETCGLWRVLTVGTDHPKGFNVREAEYICRRLIVATGENAVPVVPDIPGIEKFKGHIAHACAYRNGDTYTDQDILVVGSGNSGMEVSLDLANHNARPAMVVRSQCVSDLEDLRPSRAIPSSAAVMSFKV